MAQVSITGPDGNVIFFCKGGEAPLVNIPDQPSAAPIETKSVVTTPLPPSYNLVQTQMDDLHTKTMDFFAKWLKTGGNNNASAGVVTGGISVVTAEAGKPAAEAEADEEDDGGQLDLDTEGGAMNQPDGKRPVGAKSARAE